MLGVWSEKRASFVEGSLESLPFRATTFDRIVALGVLPFVSTGLPEVLEDLAHLLQPRGVLIFDLRAPSQAMMTVLPRSPATARSMLRHPDDFHAWSVVRNGFQPYDPEHHARLECVWKRPQELSGLFRRSGLRQVDRMAVAPNFGRPPELVRALHRDASAYATSLLLEEETGRWPELAGAGTTILLAAARPKT